MQFWLQLLCTLLLGEHFCLCFYSLPSPSLLPPSLSYVAEFSLLQCLWVFWCPMSLCCSFDQGKCGSLGRYPELFLIFHKQWQNSDGNISGDTHKLIQIFLSSVVIDCLNSYNTESFLTIVTFFSFQKSWHSFINPLLKKNWWRSLVNLSQHIYFKAQALIRIGVKSSKITH